MSLSSFYRTSHPLTTYFQNNFSHLSVLIWRNTCGAKQERFLRVTASARDRGFPISSTDKMHRKLLNYTIVFINSHVHFTDINRVCYNTGKYACIVSQWVFKFFKYDYLHRTVLHIIFDWKLNITIYFASVDISRRVTEWF